MSLCDYMHFILIGVAIGYVVATCLLGLVIRQKNEEIRRKDEDIQRTTQRCREWMDRCLGGFYGR